MRAHRGHEMPGDDSTDLYQRDRGDRDDGVVDDVACGAEEVPALAEGVAGEDEGLLTFEEQRGEVVRDRIAGGDGHDRVREGGSAARAILLLAGTDQAPGAQQINQ